MNIESFTKVMMPPVRPFEAPTNIEWNAVENELGVSLPDDYKIFIQLYGSGRAANFLWVFNPFSRNENLNLIEQSRVQIKVLIELQFYGEILPYKLFPEENGLLPFAITDNGDVLFWQVVGEPNNWPVVINETRSPEWIGFNMTMTNFFMEVFSKRLTCSFFPKAFPEEVIVFEQ
jgi:hypothetical protein